MNMGQKELRDSGVATLGDIMDSNGGILKWEELLDANLLEKCKRPYLKLEANILLCKDRVKQTNEITLIYVANGRVVDDSTMWEFRIDRKDIAATYRMGKN